MKNKWSNPSITNLNLYETKEGSCPAADGSRHDFGILGKCKYYCSVCGGCKLHPFIQSLCLANAVIAIKHCDNASQGGCKPVPSQS